MPSVRQWPAYQQSVTQTAGSRTRQPYSREGGAVVVKIVEVMMVTGSASLFAALWPGHECDERQHPETSRSPADGPAVPQTQARVSSGHLPVPACCSTAVDRHPPSPRTPAALRGSRHRRRTCSMGEGMPRQLGDQADSPARPPASTRQLCDLIQASSWFPQHSISAPRLRDGMTAHAPSVAAHHRAARMSESHRGSQRDAHAPWTPGPGSTQMLVRVQACV